MYARLKQLRTERNIPVETLIKALGLKTKAAYYKKESGKIKFSVDDAEKISKFYGLPIEEIFFAENSSNEEQ